MRNVCLPLIKSWKFAIVFIAIGGLPQTHAAISQHSEPYISYTVVEGDNLHRISEKWLVDPKKWRELARLNGISRLNLLYPGQVIDIPSSLLDFSKQPKVAESGVLTSANGRVSVNGMAAQTGLAVPEGATVQTEAGSSALIQLSDGSKVQLMPRSLAQIVSQHGYAMKDPASSISTTWFSGVIRLVEGQIDLAANKAARRKEPLKVTTPTAFVGVRGTQFRVRHEAGAAATSRTEVLEGRVQAENLTLEARADVNGGFGVAIPAGARSFQVLPLLPALAESELPEQISRVQGTELAIWTIGSLAGAAGYHAELAQDAQFERIVGNAKTNSTSLDFSNVASGSYFIRVRGFDASGIEGYNAVRRVNLVDVPLMLYWLRPIDITATADAAGSGLTLRLNLPADAPLHLKVQMAQNAQFTQGLQNLTPDAQSRVNLAAVKAGERYFVRFIGHNPQGVFGMSEPFLLQLPSNWGGTVLSLSSALQPLK